ncbi:MAG: hypothetical protein IJY15_04620, partial [Thermoguttaceae bacterium]|nr:hypothetical protein [Thermoguttaceae bacterium]
MNYTLYYKEASAKKFFQRVVAGTSTTYYGVKGKIYEFYVVANPKYNDGYVVSAASETRGAALFDAPKTTLATPTWTNVSASKTKISLSWTKVDDALNYSLFYKEATAKNYVKRVVAKTSTTYTGIQGKTYEFYVVANPKCGSDFLASSASGTQTITLDGSSYDDGGNVGDSTTRLPAPVLSYTIDGTKIVVSWNAVDNARAYKFFWKEKSATNFKNTGEIKTTQYQITGEAGKTYVFYAVALPTVVAYNNGSRQSANSETLEAALGDFVLNGYATGNTIMLSWTPVADAVKYTVFNASGETPVEVGTTDDANASMTGQEGKTYKLYVCAYDETGAQVGEESNTITVVVPTKKTVENTLKPLPALKTFVVANGANNTLSLQLQFDPNSDHVPSMYQVQYCKIGELEVSNDFAPWMPDVNFAQVDWTNAQTMNIKAQGVDTGSRYFKNRWTCASITGLKPGDLYALRARVLATEAEKNNGNTNSEWVYERRVVTAYNGPGPVGPVDRNYTFDTGGLATANGVRYPEGTFLNTATNEIYIPGELEEVWD